MASKWRNSLCLAVGFTAAACAPGVSGVDDEHQALGIGDYQPPPDWFARSQPGAPADPLNVVITARSLYADTNKLSGLLDFLGKNSPSERWTSVEVGTKDAGQETGQCITSLQASVDPGTPTRGQDFSWRPGGCKHVGLDKLSGAVFGVDDGARHDYIRGWKQISGAWFLAVSEEQTCDKLLPTHCQDSESFDLAREQFLAELTTAVSKAGLMLSTQYQTVPNRTDGVGSGGIPYDDQILFITITAPTGPTPLPAPIGPVPAPVPAPLPVPNPVVAPAPVPVKPPVAPVPVVSPPPAALPLPALPPAAVPAPVLPAPAAPIVQPQPVARPPVVYPQPAPVQQPVVRPAPQPVAAPMQPIAAANPAVPGAQPPASTNNSNVPAANANKDMSQLTTHETSPDGMTTGTATGSMQPPTNKPAGADTGDLPPGSVDPSQLTTHELSPDGTTTGTATGWSQPSGNPPLDPNTGTNQLPAGDDGLTTIGTYAPDPLTGELIPVQSYDANLSSPDLTTVYDQTIDYDPNAGAEF